MHIKYNPSSQLVTGYIVDKRKIKLDSKIYRTLYSYIKEHRLYDVDGIEREYTCQDGTNTTIELSSENRYNVLHVHCDFLTDELEVFFKMIEDIGKVHYHDLSQ